MNKRRTKTQWLTVIREFENNGLTQAEFCTHRGIDLKYFSLRRIRL
ncbi:hypothetical protein [Gynuella sp.]